MSGCSEQQDGLGARPHRGRLHRLDGRWRSVKLGAAYAASGRVAEVESLFAHIYREASVTKHAPLVTVPFETRLEVAARAGRTSAGSRCGCRTTAPAGCSAAMCRSTPSPSTIPEMHRRWRKRFLGLPYTWGGTSSYGYDCSGFVQMLCRRRGIVLPRDAAPQAHWSGAGAGRTQGPARRATCSTSALRPRRSRTPACTSATASSSTPPRTSAPWCGSTTWPSRTGPSLLVAMQEAEMNRRDWLKLLAAAPAAAMRLARARAWPRHAVETRVVRWKLRHTWTTTMSSSQYRDNLYVELHAPTM